MCIEIFKDIVDAPNYQVSNYGRVRSLDHIAYCKNGSSFFVKGRFLKQNSGSGYYMVQLSIDGKLHPYSVHRLMGVVFLPNPDNLPCINHKDENKLNNFIWINEDGSVDCEKSNLEWCDYKYNNNYGTKSERLSKSMTGRVAWNKGLPMREDIRQKLIGRKFSEEHKKHLSEAQKKRPVTEEQLQRLRTAMLGKQHSEETRKKMSEARRQYWERKKIHK